MVRLSASCRRSRVPVAYAFQRNTSILRRFWSTQCRSRPNDQMSSRSLTIIPCEPSSPLDIHRSDPIKPNPAIPLRAQPDPTNPMNNRPSFSRCLAGATRTPPRPPDSPQSRPRLLVSSNGNLTSHAELGPTLQCLLYAVVIFSGYIRTIKAIATPPDDVGSGNQYLPVITAGEPIT